MELVEHQHPAPAPCWLLALGWGSLLALGFTPRVGVLCWLEGSLLGLEFSVGLKVLFWGWGSHLVLGFSPDFEVL